MDWSADRDNISIYTVSGVLDWSNLNGIKNTVLSLHWVNGAYGFTIATLKWIGRDFVSFQSENQNKHTWKKMKREKKIKKKKKCFCHGIRWSSTASWLPLGWFMCEYCGCHSAQYMSIVNETIEKYEAHIFTYALIDELTLSRTHAAVYPFQTTAKKEQMRKENEISTKQCTNP